MPSFVSFGRDEYADDLLETLLMSEGHFAATANAAWLAELSHSPSWRAGELIIMPDVACRRYSLFASFAMGPFTLRGLMRWRKRRIAKLTLGLLAVAPPCVPSEDITRRGVIVVSL